MTGGNRMFIVAVIPHSERWNKMRAAYDACLEAGVDVPEEVMSFFGVRDRKSEAIEERIAHRTESNGFIEFDLGDVPKDAYKIRVYSEPNLAEAWRTQ